MKKLAFLLIPIYITVCFIESYKTLYTNDTIEIHIQNDVNDISKILQDTVIPNRYEFGILVKPITDEEAWKRFDEFWIEFQNAVINEDSIKLKDLCDFESYNILKYYDYNFYNFKFKKFLINTQKIKKDFQKINKKNDYSYKYNVDKKKLKVRIYFCIDYIKKDNELIKEYNIFELKINYSFEKYYYDTIYKKYYPTYYGCINYYHSLYFALRNGRYKLICIFGD